MKTVVASLAFAVATLPALAHAAFAPSTTAELVLGVQDVPESDMIAAQPRLVLRYDRDATFSPYARIGLGTTVVAGDRGADGYTFEGAGGIDLATGDRVRVGIKLGLGLQRADYDKLVEYDNAQHFVSDTAFLETQVYVRFGDHFSLGIDLRAHDELKTVRDHHGNDETETDEGEAQYAAGLALALTF